MWSHNTISRYGLLDAWPRHYAGKFGDDNENNVWSLAVLLTSLRDATRAERTRGVCDLKREKVTAIKSPAVEKPTRPFFDEMQQPNDSLILVHFLISSVNEQFDQAELQVAGLRSGYMCACVCVRGWFYDTSETRNEAP